MKHHAFSPRAVAAAVAMAIVLAGGTTTGAMAAVTSTSAASARQATPTVPGAPTGLAATPGDGTATLSWSPPGSDGGSPVDSYVIEGGTSPSSGGIVEQAGGHRHAATISGLTNGTTYYFRVHAQNAYGDGAPAAVPVTPQGPGSVQDSGSVPGPPTGLKTSYGGGFIALSWSPPTSTGGSPITGYHVYLGYSPSLVGARVFPASDTNFRATDVETGSRYYIKVTALNAAGEGPPTPVISVIPVPPNAPLWPSRPTGLAAHARRGAVVLSWSPPKGGLKAGEGYLIYIGTSSGHEGAKPSVPYLIQNATSYTIAPLKHGTRYYFQVALLTRDNRVSARSAEASAIPRGGAGSAPGPAAGFPAGAGAPAGSGAGAAAQPSASPLPGSELAQGGTSSSLPAGLVVLLVALVLAAAAFGTTAIILLRRQRYDRRYGHAAAPRQLYDDQPTRQYRRTEEMNGPRYR
jgi:fibronectin type III domain protein